MPVLLFLQRIPSLREFEQGSFRDVENIARLCRSARQNTFELLGVLGEIALMPDSLEDVFNIRRHRPVVHGNIVVACDASPALRQGLP